MPPKRKAKKGGKSRTQVAPKPVKEIILAPEHSFGLVRTAIAATMFEVIFARKVFPSSAKSWETRFYDLSDEASTYESFISSTQGLQKAHGRNWHVPIRGQHPVLDRLMNHFEHGIKDVLEKKYLRKLALCFYPPGPQPLEDTNRIESYELSVSYGLDGTPYISNETRDIEVFDSTDMNLHEGKTKLQTMINGIIGHFKLLPEVISTFKLHPLPENIRLALKLEYTSQTPRDYEPPGFRRYNEIAWGNDDETGFLEGAEHKLETGFHSVAFRAELPGNRDSATKSLQPDVVSTETRKPNTDQARSKDVSWRSRQPVIPRRSLSRFSVSDGDRTQPENMREVQRVPYSRHDYDTTQDTQQYPMTYLPLPRTAATAKLDIPQYRRDLREYAESKLKDLVSRDNDDLDTLQGINFNCECTARLDGPAIQCLECSTFHHAECYGYISQGPRAEFCYTCLEALHEEHETFNLEDRKFDCKLRRTIRLFQNMGGLITFKEVVSHLGMDPKDERSKEVTVKVVKDLLNDGYIVDRTVAKSQDMIEFSKFILATGKDEMVQSQLFNYRTGIDHLFADNRASFDENLDLLESVEVPEVSDRGGSTGVPFTPTANGSSNLLMLRGLQSSSWRAHPVDTDTTVSSPRSTPHLPDHRPRERSVNSEFQTMTIRNVAVNEELDPGISSSYLPRQISGIKRPAQTGPQARSSRRKAK